MQAKKVKDLKRGELFKRKPMANKVYSRGEYLPEFKKYLCDDMSDISNDILIGGNTIVYVGFTY